jgi:small nuclear ribonucleoprotein (snRNP)-like protein
MAPVAPASSSTKRKSSQQQQQSAVDGKKFPKSLGSLLRYMEGIEVIVELKTGKRHRGVLESADEFMNLSLEGVDHGNNDDGGPSAGASFPAAAAAPAAAVMVPQHQGNQDVISDSSGWHPSASLPPVTGMENLLQDSIYSSLDIRGSNIRYIHFPDNADLSSLVKAGADRERNATKKYSRGKRKK